MLMKRKAVAAVTTAPEERTNGGPDAVSVIAADRLAAHGVRAIATDVIAAVHVPGATGHIGGTVAELIVDRLAAHGFKIVRS